MSIKERLIFSLANGACVFLLLWITNAITLQEDGLLLPAIWASAWTVGMFVGKSVATFKKNVLIKILFDIATILFLLILIGVIVLCFNIPSTYFIYMLASYGMGVIAFTFI